MPDRDANRRAAYWRHTCRLTWLLLAIWLGVTFAVIFFARELAGLSLFGWSLSFYLAAQGAIVIYLAIVGVYALKMKRLDARFGEDSHGG